MQDHSYQLPSEGEAPEIVFAENFNVAVPFIDRHLNEGRGTKTVIKSNHGEAISYQELADKVCRAGNLIKGLGTEKGDKVIMIVKDCPEFFYVFWGAIKAGRIPIPVNTLLRTKDYEFIIKDSGSKLVIFSPEFAEEVEPAMKALKNEGIEMLCIEGDGGLKQRILDAPNELEPEPAKAEDPCFMLYSSGSTGNPKGAVHLHRDMVVTSEFYGVRTLGVLESDSCFSAAKLFFAYGLGNGMTFPLWVGGTSILFDARPTPATTFETIERFKPSLYFGVPTLYAAQLQDLESNQRDTSSIRLCVSAGEALPGDILNRWKKMTGLKILDGIGSTEILHIFISNRVDEIKPGSSGKLVPGYEAKIVDEEGKPVAQGDPGQLLIKGKSIASHYWNNPEKTAATMLGEWINTGDTYYQDEEGYFFYCGRNDDMLKVGGIWCSPFEIEATLIEHPKVLEAAIVGRADDNNLIKPEAHLILKNPADAGPELEAELQQHCKDHLAHYKYPRWYQFHEELPKTATGKIQRFKLRQV